MKKSPTPKTRQQKIADDQSRDLPGYPHYPEIEDLMEPAHGMQKIYADEELANSRRLSSAALRNSDAFRRADGTLPVEGGAVYGAPPAQAVASQDDDRKKENAREAAENSADAAADVTEEDLENLGDIDGDQDMGEDEFRGDSRVDRLDGQEGLDIPGAELDNEGEDIGAEDEENNYYSLGGDRHKDSGDDE